MAKKLTKKCQKCGKEFEKRDRDSMRQWGSRKLCSRECHKLTTKEQAVRKALKQYSSLKERGLCPYCYKPNIEEGICHKICSQKRYINTKESRRNWSLIRLYGINSKEYDEKLKEQNGKCAICGGTSGKRKLSVDHCHETGIVRGLLCDNCNHGLGKFQDNIELLKEVIKYLEQYE